MDILAIIGAVTFSIGWAWLAITAFQKGSIFWGILIILFHSIAGLVFCIVKKTGWIQYGLMILGMLILTLGFYIR